MLRQYLQSKSTLTITTRVQLMAACNHSNFAPITTIKATDLPNLSPTHIIDVRTPLEFEQDRIPNAINLPILNQTQHGEVGTKYKGNPFQARKMGASYVARNIADMLDSFFCNKDTTSCQPLIYCFRGGQRSQSLTHILSQIGYRTYFLEGGYKSYRQQVVKQLKEETKKYTFVLLSGHTGSGKTKVLDRMRVNGYHTIDLEELAEHRGSLLGHTNGIKTTTQPSQKMFESRVCAALQNISMNETKNDANDIIWLEAESNKIGNLHIPNELWLKMKESKRVNLIVPIEERVKYTMNTYQYWMMEKNQKELMSDAVLGRLNKIRGKEWLQHLYYLINEQHWNDVVLKLLNDHYDVLYKENEKRYQSNQIGQIKYFHQLESDHEIDTYLLPQIKDILLHSGNFM
jgi:tRNA 2-selenouridine synthase